MKESFDIGMPSPRSTGDYLSFDIIEGDKKWQGRISGTALKLLDPSEHLDWVSIFASNLVTIRQAAYQQTRNAPPDTVVRINSDFL